MEITCGRCGDGVREGTRKCPTCEYEPRESMELVGVTAVVAGAALSTVPDGAIVGVPIALFGLYRLLEGTTLTVDSEYRSR